MKPYCNICHTGANFLLSKDGYEEYLCPNCGLSFVYPLPRDEWLEEKIYSESSGYQGNKQTDLSSTRIDNQSKRILDLLIQKRPKGKLLDVGCSNGQFMYWARGRGLDPYGVELNARTAKIAKASGFDVHIGFIESSAFSKGSFDIIVLGDVIEHVTDPKSFLETCISFLKADGIIVVSTPNMDCIWCKTTFLLYKIFGIPWAPLTPPHHLTQFSKYNLDLLFSKMEYKPFNSFYIRPMSLKYELGSLHLYKKYKSQKTIFNFLYMLVSFGLYAILYAINALISPFLSKDFHMNIIYEKK